MAQDLYSGSTIPLEAYNRIHLRLRGKIMKTRTVLINASVSLGVCLGANLSVCTSAYGGSFANLYDCEGEATSASLYLALGSTPPSLRVMNLGLGGSETFSFNLDQVSSMKSPMGHVTTGYYAAIADAKLSFTLIVPTVVVQDQPIANVSGMLVRSFQGTMPPPSNVTILGPREQNTFKPVVCTASIVRY